MKKYCWLSVLSGCVWAVIAYVLSFGAFGSIIVGGLIASPFIGLLVGMLYRPAYKLPKVDQFFLSLVTLYLAAAVFGLAVGFYDAYWRAIPNRMSSEVILQAVISAVMGITFTGLVLLLWPLAFLNHRLLSRAHRAP